MDFLTKKEIDGLKQDIMAKEIAVEADKYAFEIILKNGLGDSIINELKTPTKISWIDKLKLKIAKWRMLKKERNEYNKLKKIMEDFE